MPEKNNEIKSALNSVTYKEATIKLEGYSSAVEILAKRKIDEARENLKKLGLREDGVDSRYRENAIIEKEISSLNNRFLFMDEYFEIDSDERKKEIEMQDVLIRRFESAIERNNKVIKKLEQSVGLVETHGAAESISLSGIFLDRKPYTMSEQAASRLGKEGERERHFLVEMDEFESEMRDKGIERGSPALLTMANNLINEEISFVRSQLIHYQRLEGELGYVRFSC